MFNHFIYTILLICTTFCTYTADVHAQNSPSALIKITKTPTFGLPIDCEIGENCWVMNYVDMIADDGKKTDPACQARTYDGHKGTDFMILDEATMQKGVNVIAPLDGIVSKVRDGEIDRFPTDEDLETTKTARKECGNAVMIDHGDGVQTIYCHMKENSIRVKSGQDLKKGDVIGQVGLSGFTQFPHLHFGIIKDGKITDPFTGLDNGKNCGKRKNSLWDKDVDLSYTPILIQSVGFTNDIPNLKNIERNAESLPTLNLTSDLMTFWVTLLGVQEGDKINIEIRDPNNKIFASRDIIQDKTRARQFYYTGRRTTQNPLLEGVYTGTVTISRDFKDQIISEEEFGAVLITK